MTFAMFQAIFFAVFLPICGGVIGYHEWDKRRKLRIMAECSAKAQEAAARGEDWRPCYDPFVSILGGDLAQKIKAMLDESEAGIIAQRMAETSKEIEELKQRIADEQGGGMGQPKYCFMCDTIKVKFKKDETVVEYLSNGAVASTQTLPYRVEDELVISTHSFVPVDKEPPKQYSIEDLMQMIDLRRTSGQSD